MTAVAPPEHGEPNEPAGQGTADGTAVLDAPVLDGSVALDESVVLTPAVVGESAVLEEVAVLGVVVPVRPAEPALEVLARAQWPESEEDILPPIAGFVVSDFNPLVAEVARRCLHAHYGEPPADLGRGRCTGLVLASVRGDVATARAVADAVAEGRRVPPLLFFQSNPNAVLGHVAALWGLAGPVVCTSPTGDPEADALACAELLTAAGEADEVLVIVADLADAPGGTDQAHALLVTARGRP